MTEITVGSVTDLYRYLVKSMRGEAIAQTRVGWPGLEGDRRYAFVQAGNPTRFPWLTAREVPTLLLYTPYLCDPTDPVTAAVRVRTPAAADLSIDSEELHAELSRAHGSAIHLLHSGRGLHDSAGVSLISTATVRSLAPSRTALLDPRRFRPNIVIEMGADLGAEEDQWVGGLLVFGERSDGARLRVNRKDKRCMMVNLDPLTAVQDPSVLRAVVQSRETCAGIYATTECPGTIQIGDVIRLHGQ